MGLLPIVQSLGEKEWILFSFTRCVVHIYLVALMCRFPYVTDSVLPSERHPVLLEEANNETGKGANYKL